jgi:PEP-CTERM motif
MRDPRRNIGRAVAILGLLMAGVATPALKADLVTISAAGATQNPITPSADYVTLSAAGPTGNTVPSNVPTVVNIQAGTFFVGNSPDVMGNYSVSLTENITINGVTRSVMISGTDAVTTTSDVLTLNATTPISFGNVLFNTLAYTSPALGVNQSVNFTLQGQVTSTPVSVPEPSTSLAVGFAALAALGVWARRRRAECA